MEREPSCTCNYPHTALSQVTTMVKGLFQANASIKEEGNVELTQVERKSCLNITRRRVFRLNSDVTCFQKLLISESLSPRKCSYSIKTDERPV